MKGASARSAPDSESERGGIPHGAFCTAFMEKVILVDENDKETGIEEKLKAHKDGKLHRAFSIFVFKS